MGNKIALTIKKLRNEAHLTQKKLADETGISLSAIIAYENSRREPNSKSMAILENYFNVSGAYLRGETDIKEKMIWEDMEIMEAIRDGLPDQLANLALSILKQTDDNQKLVYDIIVEIQHVLNIEDEKYKSMFLDLAHKNISSINKVIKSTLERK